MVVVDGLTLLATLVGAYLIGSIPTAVWVAKSFGLPDPRTFGSGNPGATNMLRSGGKASKWAALITLLGDALKGGAAVAIAHAIAPFVAVVPALALLGAVLGHCFSWMLKFQGGKGVATAIGAILVYYPPLAGLIFLVFFGVLAVSRMVSLSSTVAAFLAPFIVVFALPLGLRPPFEFGGWDFACMVLMSCVVIYRHRANLLRVWQSSEPRLGERKP